MSAIPRHRTGSWASFSQRNLPYHDALVLPRIHPVHHGLPFHHFQLGFGLF